MNLFVSGAIGPAQAWLLVGVAVACALTDLVRKRVYNAITYPAILAGFVVQIVTHGWPGLWSALGGFAVGFFPAYVLFVLGGMGGGDVKLMGAIGAIVGGVAATEALIIGFVVGAFIGFAKLAWHGVLLRSLLRQARILGGFIVPSLRPTGPIPPELRHEIRFGLALAIGALFTLWDLQSGALLGLLA